MDRARVLRDQSSDDAKQCNLQDGPDGHHADPAHSVHDERSDDGTDETPCGVPGLDAQTTNLTEP